MFLFKILLAINLATINYFTADNEMINLEKFKFECDFGRHGQHMCVGITGGGSDGEEFGLTPTGKEQAAKLGQVLKERFGDTIYPAEIHSDMWRSRGTAEIVSGIIFEGKEFTQYACPKLKEIHHGASEQWPDEKRKAMWKESIPAKIAEWQSNHQGEPIPLDFKYTIHPLKETGAETYNELYDRVYPEIVRVVDEIAETVFKEYADSKEEKIVIRIVFHVHNAVMQRIWTESKRNEENLSEGDRKLLYGEDGLLKLHWENKLLGNGTIDRYNFDLKTKKMSFIERIAIE